MRVLNSTAVTQWSEFGCRFLQKRYRNIACIQGRFHLVV